MTIYRAIGMSNSQLHTRPFTQAQQAILHDSYVHATVYRADERMADFQARIALAAGGAVGRDGQAARGDSSPGYYILACNAQLARDGVIASGDEVWAADGNRYRVVAMDISPHEAQGQLQRKQ